MSNGKKFYLGDFEVDMVFSGNTHKNIAELLLRAADMTYDATLSIAPIEAIWKFWRQKPNNVLVPGHDQPFWTMEFRENSANAGRAL